MSIRRRVAMALCSLMPLLPGVLAGFDSAASNNIAIYWGQNSINRADGQKRLATYCANSPVNIIPLAFLTTIKNPTSVNFANAGDNCTVFPGTQLLRCPEIEADIQTCQSLGKTLLLSLGGATYTEGGFTSPSEASTWADTLWAMFGPSSSSSTVLRPFGAAVLDGFDMDFEATSSNMAAFASTLRSRMDAAQAATGKKYYLSAAPQCPFPDAAMGEMLGAVGFDFVSVQFYNNYCGATSYVAGSGGPGNFNFQRWDQWARGGESVNKGVKVLLGIPGSAGAAGSGYVSGQQLKAVVEYSRGFASFGGVMVWDMSQVYANTGFLDSIVSALGGSLPPPTSTTTTTTATRTSTTLSTVTTKTATTTSSSASPTGSLVPQWGQCGGNGYTGPTACQPPYKCVYGGEWWSSCQ
ncbi:endochitinase 33 [Staphylotrichum tortipilum]|uniref:chitinase n=1 Tax=Staphylotrichum tortipilum TaxID=2831512 RepID=A0AAN6MDV3_9PEZI|nr:endochitinase 33 [Staphylotrichum longicolle]